MGAKKISQLQELTTLNLSGITTVVESGVTYQTSLESIKEVIHTNNEITYSELVNLIQTSGLTPMYDYLITDFATTYWMFDGNGDECNGGVPIVGPVEPIIVKATTSNTIDNFALSTVYHDDIIEYNWDPTDFIFDDAFYNTPDFKGVITYRREVNKNNSAGWDIRTVKYRRWESTAPAWNSTTNYIYGSLVTRNNIMYLSLTNNIDVDPIFPASSLDWVQILDLNTNKYWNSNPSGITFNNIFIPSIPSSYYDFPTMELEDISTYNNTIKITPFSAFDSQIQTRLSNIILIGVSINTNFDEGCQVIMTGGHSIKLDFKSSVSRVILGDNCKDLLIRSNCERLIFAGSNFNVDYNSSCSNVLLGINSNDVTLKIGCYDTTIGGFCKSLTFGPNSFKIIVGSYCSKLRISSNSSSIYFGASDSSIEIGDNCSGITISNICSNILFENYITDIFLPLNSINNVFESYTTGNFVNSTHVKQIYKCIIYKNAGGDVKLRYYDATDTLQQVGINV